MTRWNSLPTLVRQIIIGIGLFASGAVFTFGYSYRPLHGALSRKVDQLETRLDQRNRDDLSLRDELSKLRSQEASRVDPETLARVERDLDRTQRALGDAERKIQKAERRRREANTNADRWRKRYETLRDTPPEAISAAPAIQSSPEPTPPSPAAMVGPDSLVRPLGPSTSLDPGMAEQSTPTPGKGILPPSDAPDLP